MRVRQVHALHIERLKSNPSCTIADTAIVLGRSFGSVCEDLMLASWMKSHPRIEKYKTIRDALEFIRSKKKEMRMEL